MKQESFYAKRIYPLVFMLIVTVVCIVITSGIHLSTQDRVEANEQLFLRTTVLDAAGIMHSDDFREITDLFEKKVRERDSYYMVTLDSGEVRYVIPIQGPGLWGTIALMVGFEQDLKTLSGVGILSQNETPGLGARIEEPWYLEQFRGKVGPFTLVPEGVAGAINEIDAITGATRTSDAMLSIMNRVVVDSPKIVKGE